MAESIFKNKVAVITGSSMGLGKAIAKELLKGLPIECPIEKEYAYSAYHNFVIKIENIEKREDFREYLASAGISTGVHYEPIHLHSVFKDKCRAENLKVTDKVWKKLITLPLFPTLTHEQQNSIVEKIKRFYGRSKKV